MAEEQPDERVSGMVPDQEVRIAKVSFPETPEEELLQIQQEIIDLGDLSETLKFLEGKEIPGDVYVQVKRLISFTLDLVSPAMPRASDMDLDLKKAAQELNLSRVLRERALARLYQLTSMEDKDGVPLYLRMVDTDTGEPFRTQEDFLDWFRRNARISRSLVFLRKSTYDRLVKGLGLTLEKAFKLTLTKPSVIYMVLDNAGVWGRTGKLLSVKNSVARGVADLLPHGEERSQIETAIKNNNERALITAVVPALVNLIEEVASNPNAKDAMDFVRHDVLRKPRIKAWWDPQVQCFMVQMETTTEKNNVEEIEFMQTVRLLVDAPEVDPVLLAWIADKLQVRNKESVVFL